MIPASTVIETYVHVWSLLVISIKCCITLNNWEVHWSFPTQYLFYIISENTWTFWNWRQRSPLLYEGKLHPPDLVLYPQTSKFPPPHQICHPTRWAMSLWRGLWPAGIWCSRLVSHYCRWWESQQTKTGKNMNLWSYISTKSVVSISQHRIFNIFH